MRAHRRYYADLAIASLQDHAYASLGPQQSHSSANISSALAELPPPMLLDNEAQSSSCLTGIALQKAIVPELSSVSASTDADSCSGLALEVPDANKPINVPYILIPNCLRVCSATLVNQCQLSNLCWSMQTDWTFVDEGKPGRPKMGYRTLVANTSIVMEVLHLHQRSSIHSCLSLSLASQKLTLMQVDTTSQDTTSTGDVLLALGLLKSYAHMGSLSITCVSGCTCKGIPQQSLTHGSHTSEYRFTYFPVSQHKVCRVRVTSLPETQSGEHKVKFDTLMIGSGINSDWADLFNAISSSPQWLNTAAA